MKIERIKKSLDLCRIFHKLLVSGEVFCEWKDDDGLYCMEFYSSYNAAYRKLKKAGVLTKHRRLNNYEN